MRRPPAIPLTLASIIFAALVRGQTAGPTPVRSIKWEEAKTVVERMADGLPKTLGEIPPSERPTRWPLWVTAERQIVAARLSRGEEDSVVNLLLFGTSFTTQPRLTPAYLANLDQQWKGGNRRQAEEILTQAYRKRASDLVAAATKPGTDERMQFAGSLLERNGFRLSAEDGRRKASEYLLGGVVRVQNEAADLGRALDAARQMPDATQAFAERSRLFRTRGVAPDSSVMTQYAVDCAIAALRDRKLVASGGVDRVAIVGPGLDFVDKQEGYDFYPPQSLQPLATADSLMRSGLSLSGKLAVTTLDVNQRVNTHLRRAVDRAKRTAAAYRLVLPLDSGGGWVADAVTYWQRLGDRIGTSVDVAVPTALPGIRARGVAVRSEVVGSLTVLDANIVYDRLEQKPAELFDLVVATNVLIYYDTFEQTLALANLASMLRPGGILISNNSLLQIPEIPMRSAGYVTVRFSNREGDGEHMVFYERMSR